MSGSIESNIGNGNSPFPIILVTSMKLKISASVGEFDSLKKLNAEALNNGSQGNVNAYKILGLIVG